MFSRILASILAGAALLAGADIRGTITIDRQLTHRSVTAPMGLYQRGVTVELGSNEEEDPLAFERSHVAIYLEEAPKLLNLPASEQKPFFMEQRDRRFVPDLLVIPAGATVAFPNFDPIFHNVFSLSKPKNFDLGNYPKGSSRTVTFPKAGLVAVYCHLHPNMSGSIVVAPTVFLARGDRDGNFILKDVPPGNYSIVAWHKTAGAFRKTVAVGKQGGEVNFLLPYVEPTGSHIAHR